MRKKVLFLCSANPLGVGGGEFATRSYLKSVCELADGNVDLLITDDWHDDFKGIFRLQNIYTAQKRSRLQVVCQYLALIIDRFSQKAIQIVDEHPNEYSCVVANGSILAGSICCHLNKKGIPIIAIYHNYEPEYYKDNFHGIKKLLFLPAVKMLERRAFHKCDINLFLSSQDKKRFMQEYGATKARNAELGVFEYEDSILVNDNNSESKETLTYVITGSLNTVQGEDGVKYFFEELFCRLPEKSNVIVAGKKPSVLVRNLCLQHPNVTLVPSPKNIFDVISMGDVYICPTRLGGGVKLRVMDGLRLGLPVITHACSARGYDLFWESSSFEIFNTPDEFEGAVKRIEKLFNEKELKKKSIFDQYIDVFSYNAGLNRMRNAIKEFL